MMNKIKKAVTALAAFSAAALVIAAPVRADERNDAYLESIKASTIAAAEARDNEAAKGLADGLAYLMSIDMSTLRAMIVRDAQAASGLERGYDHLKSANEALAELEEADILKGVQYLDSIDTATASAIVSKDLKAADDSISGIRYLLTLDASLDPSIVKEDLQILDSLSAFADEARSVTSSILAQ